MRNGPPPTPEIQEFYTGLQKSFANLFSHKRCKRDIAEVINSLERKQLIADLMQSAKGSFSTIFLPFHVGTPQFATVTKHVTLHPKLLRFCTLATKIEGLTDTMGITGKEPDEGDKTKLLPLLKEFLVTLPAPEEFDSWLQ